MKGTVNAAATCLLALVLATGSSAAQSADTAGPDSATPAPEATEPGKKKGGGLLGKAKKLAGNKAVQQVAKTMACNMVPGGQVVAGAIDAASSEDVGEAAAGAAGAAAGQPCMPDGLAAGAAQGAGVPGAAPAAGIAGAAGLGATGAAGMLGGMPSGSAIDQAMIGMGSARSAGGAAAYGPPDPATIAACLGLTPEEFAELQNPTGGEPRQPTKEELQRQQQLSAKMDMARYQACMMQQQGAAMAPGDMAGGDPPNDGQLSEAPGKPAALPDDLARDIRKGRVVVRDIDWLGGAGVVTEGGTASFDAAMEQLGAALARAGGTWRADVYLDKRYDDVAAAAIGAARLTTVVTALGEAGVDRDAVTPGKTKKDKRPRLEIVREKP